MIEQETLRLLEFDKIRSILSGSTLTPAGKALSESISPLDDDKVLNRRLDETTEMAEILNFEEPFPLQRVDDADILLERVSAEGTFLDPHECLKIRVFLEVCDRLQRYMKNKSDKYPLLAGHLSGMRAAKQITDAIDKAIDKTGEVKDSASSRLRSIRIEKSTTRNRILSKLEKLVRSRKQHSSRQDDIVTIRDGRFVIPVAEHDFTSQAGVVHDRSKSGATLYVEPMETVELNNRLRSLDSEEEREIEKILTAIADLIRTELPSLIGNYRVLSEIDFIHSRGRLSVRLGGNRPSIVSETRIKLENAYHPLLLIRSESRGDVVPLTMSLGGKFDILVVTGPNTGGKTVALKTVGLLTLMARSGLHIPATDKSEIGAVRKLFADIGDEQSIELSLSTFSSHLSRIIHALQECDSETMILLDEIGAGTDPKEGSALGESILNYMLKKESLAFVTTHYSALKTLSEKYARIENASLEFDQATLEPSYRFLVGLPGSSYAVEIARRLGMPPDVVSDSEKLVGAQEKSLTKLLERLEDELKESRVARRELEEQKSDFQKEREKLNKREAGLRKREETLKQKDLEESSGLVEATRRELEALVKKIRETSADPEEVKEAHSKLKEIGTSLKTRKKRLEDGQRKRREELKQGDTVLVETLQTSGTLLEYIESSDSWKIQVGSMISTVKAAYLTRQDGSAPTPSIPSGVNYSPFEDISAQISLIGMTVEEATSAVEAFLDRASLGNLETVYILHGKGTGALRRAVKEYLSTHPFVKDFRLGYVNEGSSGVTVVTLKRD